MMRYPLHTTGELESLPALLQQTERYAVFMHVHSDDDRLWACQQITQAGWKLVGRLPCFFVLAVHPNVIEPDMDRLIEYLQPSKDKERIRFLGKMFGYSQWEVQWYEWALGMRESWSTNPE